MGTDIHFMFQKQTDAGWEDIPSQYEGNRHYDLFAHLAGVRNGFGFAGVITGQPVKPISEPRGLPDDFELTGDYQDQRPLNEDTATEWELDCLKRWPEEGFTRWMGSHSFSWLTAQEILQHNWNTGLLRTGVITLDQYEAWDKTSKPSSYCGGISGQGVTVCTSPEFLEAGKFTHVQVTWKENGDAQYRYFLDEVERLVALHGGAERVRFVFGFDS